MALLSLPMPGRNSQFTASAHLPDMFAAPIPTSCWMRHFWHPVGEAVRLPGWPGWRTFAALPRPPAAARTADQELALQRMAPSDKAMFERIRTGTPASVADEAVVSAVTASKQRGIDQADKISAVAMDGDRLFVVGNTPGLRSMTDVSQPQPELQRGVAQLQTQNQEQSLDQQRQQSEEQQRSTRKSAAMSV